MHIFNKQCQQKKYAGFSLVELLIVVSLVTVIIAFSIQSFSEYAHLQQYHATRDNIQNKIAVMQKQTMASLGDTVYGVYIGTSTVEFFEGPTPTVGNSANTIVDLQNSAVTATSSFADGSWFITFARLTGQPTATGTITITNTQSGASSTLTIHESGLIE